jgi:hypothetical protein
MKKLSACVTIHLKAGLLPDYVIRERAAYEIPPCNLENLRQTFTLLLSSKHSTNHPDLLLRVHYYLSDGTVKQQMTKINTADPSPVQIQYLPPGNFDGSVVQIGFSCDVADLSFTVEAFEA